MEDILAGITPVNGGSAATVPTQNAAPQTTPNVIPQSAPAPNPMQTGDIAGLEVVPTAPVATAVPPVLPDAVPAAVPVVNDNPAPTTPAYTPGSDDTAADRMLGMTFESAGIDGASTFEKIATNALTADDVTDLRNKLGANYDLIMEASKQRITEKVQERAAPIFESVGGADAWNYLSGWVKSLPDDVLPMSERTDINKALNQGGAGAVAVAQQLKAQFDQRATEQDKANMAGFLQGTPSTAPAAQAPAPAAAAPQSNLMQGTATGATPATATFEPIKSARELAKISREAQADGTYTPQFEDQLVSRLKKSKAAGVYKRISVPTPAPANMSQAISNRY